MYIKRVTVKLQVRWGPVGGFNATNGGLFPLNPNGGYGGEVPQYLPPSPTLSPNMSPSPLRHKSSMDDVSMTTGGGGFSPIRPPSPTTVGFDFNRPDSPERTFTRGGDGSPGSIYSPQAGLNFQSSPSPGAFAQGPGLDRPPSSSGSRMGSPDRPRTVPNYATIRPDTVGSPSYPPPPPRYSTP